MARNRGVSPSVVVVLHSRWTVTSVQCQAAHGSSGPHAGPLRHLAVPGPPGPLGDPLRGHTGAQLSPGGSGPELQPAGGVSFGCAAPVFEECYKQRQYNLTGLTSLNGCSSIGVLFVLPFLMFSFSVGWVSSALHYDCYLITISPPSHCHLHTVTINETQSAIPHIIYKMEGRNTIA